MLGILTGLQQEAALIRRVLPHPPIALSHASEEGAVVAMEKLRQEGVTKVLSFGCAGGLCPSLKAGTVIVADFVHVDGIDHKTDAELSEQFGCVGAMQGGILHSSVIVKRAVMKRRVYQDTGCLAVDMESGVAARSGLPFAVLRVVCDDAMSDLPPAVEEGMREGRVHIVALIRSLLRSPGQIPSLMRLGRSAANARRTMAHFLVEHKIRLREKN